MGPCPTEIVTFDINCKKKISADKFVDNTVDPHLSEPQLSDFPDYPNAKFMTSNEIH